MFVSPSTLSILLVQTSLHEHGTGGHKTRTDYCDCIAIYEILHNLTMSKVFLFLFLFLVFVFLLFCLFLFCFVFLSQGIN